MAKRKPVEHKTDASSAIADAFSEIESLCGELQDWYDNLPENFQNGDKGERLQEAIGMLESNTQPSPSDELEALLAKTDVVYRTNGGGRMSRSDRRYEAIALLDAAINALQQAYERGVGEKDAAIEALDLDGFIGELTDARDEWDGVEFPGMFG